MNIAIYADRLESGGGLETHVITQVNELLRRGHRVFLSTNAILPYYIQQIDDKGNFIYAPFSCNTIADLGGIKPDLVHVHPFSAIFRGYEVACALGVPLFITIHGLYDFGVDRSPSGNLVAGKASKIIAIDDTIAAMLGRCIEYPEKIATIYNGINLGDFCSVPEVPDLIKELDIEPDWRTILIISRLEDDKEKPVLQLLDCIPFLADRLDGLNFLIVGDGAYRDQVWARNRIQLENCSNLRVRCLGRRNDIARLHQTADLVIACGRAALEALASGKPVFAAGSRGYAGLVNCRQKSSITGREGYEWWDDGMLIDNLYLTLSNHELLTQASCEGNEIVNSYFDIHRTTDQLEALYHNAAEGNNDTG
jgi:Glycosyltransferase